MIDIVYNDGGALRTVRVLDVSRNNRSTTSPTDHPVEDGADISDHIRPELDTFSAECFVSNSLIEDESSNMDGARVVQRAVKLPSGRDATVIDTDVEVDRVKSVYDELRTIQRTRKLVVIVTPLRRYQDMAITELGFPITNKSGVQFSLEAREVRLVQSETVDVPVPRDVRGAASANAGRQLTEFLGQINQITANALDQSGAPTRSGAAAILDSITGG